MARTHDVSLDGVRRVAQIVLASWSHTGSWRLPASRGDVAAAGLFVPVGGTQDAASHNTLVQVCAQVVRGVTLDLIVGKLAQAEAPDELMSNRVLPHSNAFEAIRNKDGHRAATLMRGDIFDYYSPYVLAQDQPA